MKFAEGNFAEVDLDAVYLIGYRDPKTNKRYVVYVGQGRMKERLEDHLNNDECANDRIAKGGVGYYRHAACPDENDRLDIELGLYRNHGGKEKLCNQNEPPGSGGYEEIKVEESFPE